jgi:hypothetical protein
MRTRILITFAQKTIFKTMEDLFEYPELWPANLRAILALYMAKDQTYTNLIRLENDLLKIGYSIEYGLDCVAYNLQKITA